MLKHFFFHPPATQFNSKAHTMNALVYDVEEKKFEHSLSDPITISSSLL